MNQIITQLSDFFAQQSLKQRVIIIAVLIGFLSAVFSLVLWANRTEYELLYSNLDPSAASSIVGDLRGSKIPYRLENGGSTIYAPIEYISELRLKHSQSGYLKDAISGYELFEDNKMGMTTFMQKLNMKRALEGELMRTINQFPEVRQSRVHLVIPENKLFQDDKQGSASVVLHLQPGASLNTSQVKGVGSLVANSVDGIELENVVVMDDLGNVLIEGPKDNGIIGTVGNQYELQHAIESELQKKVKEIVGGVVGRENTVVKVSAELNFDQIERTREEVDPENVVVLSEEKYTESSKSNLDSSDFIVEKTTSNYELSKTHERFISNTGDIKRLTVAVLVNGKYQTETAEDETVVKNYEPRSDEELRQISALVKSAVGYSEDRGDVVEVQNMELLNTQLVSNQEYFNEGMRIDLWKQLLTYGLLALGLLLGFFLLRGLLKTSVSQIALPALGLQPAATTASVGGADQPAGSLTQGAPQQQQQAVEEELPEDMFMKKLSPEARAKLRANDKMTNEVMNFAKENPENATKLLRSWITKASK